MKTINIIGAGNSLRGFDFSKIKGDIMAVNKVCYNIPRFDYVVAWDYPFVESLAKFGKKLHTLKHYNIKGVKGWIQRGDYTIKKGSVASFNTSLCFGLNVALNLKYNEIHILGADNYIDSGYLHFYDTEKNPYYCEKYNKELFPMVDKYMRIISQQTDANITMVESTIKHFKNISLDEFSRI